MTDTTNDKCFVISPIGDPGSPTRNHMDMVFKYIIKPALLEAGYEDDNIYRSDHDDDPGLITDRMIESIAKDKLVVAVLTEMNPNVFYELGIRHTFQKPAINLVASGTKLPFDTNDQRTISYEINSCASHEDAIEQLYRAAKKIDEDDFQVSNPVTHYKDFQKLRESEDPIERTIAAQGTLLVVLQNQLKYLTDQISKITPEDSLDRLRGPKSSFTKFKDLQEAVLRQLELDKSLETLNHTSEPEEEF